MSQNEAFAAAAHLHVLLRRKTGRVTDTEWMVSNFEYAQAIVRFARDKASEDGHDDLLPLAEERTRQALSAYRAGNGTLAALFEARRAG